MHGTSMSQMEPPLTPEDREQHGAKQRLRATSIPEGPRARGTYFSDVHEAPSQPVTKVAPLPQARSTRISLPNTRPAMQNHPNAIHDLGRDFRAQIYPTKTQHPYDQDDSDDEDIADVIHSARLGGDTDDDYHTEESASMYQSDFMATNDASNSTASFDPPSRPQPEQQYQDSFRSRRLPSPPIPQMASTSSRLGAAPAGPRPRSQSRSKIPSAFLLAPRPLLHQEEAKFREAQADDDVNDNEYDDNGTPEAQSSSLTEVGLRLSDNPNLVPGDHEAMQAQKQAGNGRHVALPSGGGAVGLGSAISGAEIRKGSSSLVQKKINSTQPEYRATEVPETHHTTSRLRESGSAHASKAGILVETVSIQPSTSRPQMPASTSIKARIAELERAGLNKAR